MIAPSSRRIAAYVYGVAALFLVAVAALAWVMVQQNLERAMAETESQAVRFVSGAEAALNRSLLGIDILLASLDQLLPAAGDDSVDVPPGANDRLWAKPLLERAVHQNLLVRYVALLDPAGRVLGSSDARGDRLRVVLPKGFLAEVLAEPMATLTISTPAVSFSSSQKVLYFARLLQTSDGGNAVAVAEVQSSLLTSILTQGADIRGLEVTLERDRGPMLASVPPREELTGRTLMPQLSEQSSGTGAVRMAGRLSGKPSVVALRPTLHRNLLIVAGIPLDAALEEWQEQRGLIFGSAGLFAFMILAVAVFTHLQLHRQWRSRMALLRSKATLDEALESMLDGVVLLDRKDRVVAWNRRFVELFPWNERWMRPLRPFQEVLDATSRHVRLDEAEDREAWLQTHLAAHRAAAGEQELKLRDGQVIRGTKSRTPDGGMVCVYQDVTEKIRHTTDILESRAELQATLDALPDLLLEVGLDGRCHRFHAPRVPLPAIDVERLAGRNVAAWLPAGAAREVMAALQDALVNGYSKGRQFERRTASGSAWFEISVSRKTVGEGEAARFILILRDTTRSQLAAREIEHLAFYDILTGLPNRRLLLDRLKQAHAANALEPRQGALLFLDLDHFKTLNDASGHAVGDLLLRQVADRLSACVRRGDTVARLGGDEFVVVLQNLSGDEPAALQEVEAVCGMILANLQRPYQLTPTQLHHSTCSIGAVLFDARQQPLEELLKQADIAMYYAKTAGGNALRFFEAGMQAAVTARATLENELHEALACQQFTLHYQSQVTSDGRIVGAEVLIRWLHPRRGLLYPGAFIQLAEDSGLIVPMGQWVLETACRQLERWSHDESRCRLQLAVNVSARQFRRADFVDQVSQILRDTGADPTLLKLELTESLLQERVDDTIEKMDRLKALGIRFSLDDFGTGYSSLSYVTQLPLDQIKVDRYFVHSIGLDPKVELIIQTIVAMAGNLGLELVAEGVETQAQREFLLSHGCHLCQGYLFSLPLPSEEFERLLDRAEAAAADLPLID